MLIDRILQWKGVPMEHELIDKLSKERVEQFAQDARVIRELNYWKWFVEDMELLAERKMFQGDKEIQTFGKGILYCLEIMQINLNKMAEGKVQMDSPEKKKMRRFL